MAACSNWRPQPEVHKICFSKTAPRQSHCNFWIEPWRSISCTRCAELKNKTQKILLTLLILALFLIFSHLHVVWLSVNWKIWHLFLGDIFIVYWFPNGFWPYKNIFEGVLVHFLLNLDDIRLVHGVITPEVRAVLFAAREDRNDNELIKALVFLLWEVKSLQHIDVLQLVRIRLPDVVLKSGQDLIELVRIFSLSRSTIFLVHLVRQMRW